MDDQTFNEISKFRKDYLKRHPSEVSIAEDIHFFIMKFGGYSEVRAIFDAMDRS